jgi:hypothetical protein
VEAVDSGFANPERGFFDQNAPLWLDLERSPQDADALRDLRQQGISMLRLYLVIDEYRDAPIDNDTLDFIGVSFAAVREAGLNVIPRFAYNFPIGGRYPYHDPDAPLERVLSHIDQLQPLLREYADVITFMEIAFVGAWGEWHSSRNHMVDEETGINDNSRAIIDRLLQALPPERMVAIRYPPYKQQLYGNAPLTAEQSFSGTLEVGMGAYNDSFLALNTDWGTYPRNWIAREALKAYLSLDNRFVPQGGETCNADEDAQPYIGYENALADLACLRYSTLNIDYQEDLLNGWREGGCFDEIADRLGYRFRLISAPADALVVAGGEFDLSITLINDGFASPYNPRGFEIILRSLETAAIYRLPLQSDFDLRRWLPDVGEITIDVEAGLPADMPVGRYDLLLSLPDPQPLLYA